MLKAHHADPVLSKRGLYDALRGVYAVGATLESDGYASSFRIVKPADATAAEWEDIRQRWLMPHAVEIRRILQAAHDES
jgi:hypothetical protein